MESLLEQFKLGLPNHSYYSIGIDVDNLFHIDACRANIHCQNFIAEHFIQGNKEGVFDLNFKQKYDESGKHTHTTSLYLLGLLFRDLFYTKIKDDLTIRGINHNDWYDKKDLVYTWYLTCLYHDVASCIENLNNQELPCCDKCIFKKKTPFSHKNIFASQRITRFSKKLVKNYCHYRISSGKQDHGIYGGILLFDKLVKNFKNKTKNHDWDNEPVLTQNELVWRREHLDHFAYVADAIICHNIWTVRSDDADGVKCYNKYHLDDLIIDPLSTHEKRLSIEEYPLQFMLCLLDTIEPVKRFYRMSAREVLENISIKATDDRTIKIAWNEQIIKEHTFWDWMKNISGLKDWMLVDVSQCQQEDNWCFVTINIR